MVACNSSCGLIAGVPPPRGAHFDSGKKAMTEIATKDNPKRAFGTLKACLSWWPLAVIFETALAFAEGGFKYGGHNYLVAPVSASDYVDATMRHLFQFQALGEDVDLEGPQCCQQSPMDQTDIQGFAPT